jgi:MYXO-CTERM domain-containing protein
MLTAWSDGASNARWLLGAALVGLAFALARREPERAHVAFVAFIVASYAELLFRLPAPLHQNAWFDYRVIQLAEVASAVALVAASAATVQTTLRLLPPKRPKDLTGPAG